MSPFQRHPIHVLLRSLMNCAPSRHGSRVSALESLKERAELRRSSELRDGVQFLKSRCERVRQAPHRARLKFRKRRIEIPFMDHAREVPWHVQFALDECLIDDELCRDVGNLALAPGIDL